MRFISGFKVLSFGSRTTEEKKRDEAQNQNEVGRWGEEEVERWEGVEVGDCNEKKGRQGRWKWANVDVGEGN